MVRLITIQRGGLATLKLTKLFGIDDFPAAKDSGKVLSIIIYCYLIIIIIIISVKRIAQQHNAGKALCSGRWVLVHRRVTPSITFAGIHLYTWMERGTVRMKYLSLHMYTTKCLRPGTEPNCSSRAHKPRLQHVFK